MRWPWWVPGALSAAGAALTWAVFVDGGRLLALLFALLASAFAAGTWWLALMARVQRDLAAGRRPRWPRFLRWAPRWVVLRWPHWFMGLWVTITMNDGTVHQGRIAAVRQGPDGERQIRLVKE